MAFCTKCGTQLADDACFCSGCGTATGATAQGNAAGSGIGGPLKGFGGPVGLTSIKEEVAKIASEEKSLKRHFLFTGKPGTEKITVARMMADLFKDAGLLPTNNVVEVDRGKLVGAYLGQTGKLVNEQCDKAIGGILYIDEAYALGQGQGDMFGQEAIDTLLQRMENDRGKFVVIMSGTANEMNTFLQTNSGLISRFTDYFNFAE
jgi:replication-associated recombination protein RarA